MQRRRDQPQHRIVALADDAAHRLVQLGQPRRAVAAQRRQRLGQPDRLDDMRAGTVDLVRAQQRGHPGQPAGGARVAARVVLPEEVVPAGRGDAGAIAAARQMPVRPRHPGRLHLELRQALEQRHIGLDRRDAVLQRRHMPGAADHRDAREAGLARRAQALAHVGLALRLARGQRRLGVGVAAQLGHHLGDGGEDVGVLAALLDPAVPPALAVRMAVGAGEVVEGVAMAGRGRHGSVVGPGRLGGVQRQRVRARQVDEARRHARAGRPAQRLPLRREAREGVEHRLLRRLHRMDQQRHRRHQRGVGQVRQQPIGLRRPLDQHRVGLPGREGAHQAARAARAVVADAEEADLGHVQPCARQAR